MMQWHRTVLDTMYYYQWLTLSSFLLFHGKASQMHLASLFNKYVFVYLLAILVVLFFIGCPSLSVFWMELYFNDANV